MPLRIQLVVVDDASSDGTRAILSRLQAELGFTLVLQPKNQGKGAAVRDGCLAATGSGIWPAMTRCYETMAEIAQRWARDEWPAVTAFRVGCASARPPLAWVSSSVTTISVASSTT